MPSTSINHVAAEFHRLDELSQRLGYLVRIAALGPGRHGTRPTIPHHEPAEPSTSGAQKSLNISSTHRQFNSRSRCATRFAA
jgi:hypothetical protein